MSTADAAEPNPPVEEPRRPLARAKRVVDGLPREARRASRYRRDDDREESNELPAGKDSIPTPPPADSPIPGVVVCFRVYCAIIALGAVIGAGFSFLPLTNNFYYDNYSSGIGEFIAFLFLALSVFTLFTVPLLFPRNKPWMWWYGLIVNIVSILSIYLTIFGLILLVVWVQPRTQRYFGRMMEIATSQRLPRRRYSNDDDDEFESAQPADRGL